MAIRVGAIEASLDLQSASFINNLERAVKSTDRAANSISKGMERATTAIKGFATAYIADKAIDGAKKFLDIVDASKKMESQLNLATAQFGQLGTAQEDVRRISKETRSDLEAITSLYGKFLPAAQTLGKTQGDAARATETFSKALKIGGADTNAATSATLQFGQALASGVLRGDEFNSVNEASPRIIRLLADSMGVTVGAMRAMAEAGKLTSDVLFKALTDRKFTKGIDDEFRQMPKTFGDAMTAVGNTATLTFGAFDRGGDFSTAITNFVTGGTEDMNNFERRVEDLGTETRAVLAGLYDAFVPLEMGGLDAADSVSARWKGVRGEIAEILGAVDNIRNFGRDYHLFGDTQPLINSKGAFEAGAKKAEIANRRRLADMASNRDSVFRFSGNPLDFKNFNPVPTKPRAKPVTSSGLKKSGGGAAKAKKPPTLAERLDKEAEGTGSYISASLAAAGSDSRSLITSLGNVNTAVADLRTGLEGVNLGSLLSDEEQQRLIQFSDGFTHDLSQGIAGAILYGENLGDVLVNSIKRASAEFVASQLFNLLNGKGVSGGGGILGGALNLGKKLLGGALSGRGSFPTGLSSTITNAGSIGSTAITGFRANGGMTPAGRYLVGERGPEVVDLPTSNVIPSHALRSLKGQAGGTVVNVDARGATDPAATRLLVMEGISAAMPMITARATSQTIEKIKRPRI